mgnify:CR=1 FL=1
MTEHPTLAPNDADETPAAAPVFNADVPHATPERPLSEAARRALDERRDRVRGDGSWFTPDRIADIKRDRGLER